MNRLIIPAILIILMLFTSCATSGKKSDIEESILLVYQELETAVESNDAEGIYSLLSPRFYHPELGNRDEVYTLMLMTLDNGFTGNFNLGIDDPLIEIDKETMKASLSPIMVKGKDNSYNIVLHLEKSMKAEGNWLISTFDTALPEEISK